MSEDPEADLPRGIALAWGVAADPRRGPKREMSVERIVDAAIELADAEGLGAVSMAAVAAKLGFTPMSLYRYVSAKDDLLLLMGDVASGVPSEAIASAEGWRAQLASVYRELVLAYVSHPWMLDIPITGSPATPSAAAWMDTCLGILGATSLDDEERMAVTLLITGHARWCGTILAVYSQQARATGRSPEEITAAEHAMFTAVISADEFPALRHAVDAGVFASDRDPFGFGLERILDGVESYVDGLAEGEPRAAWSPWVAGDEQLEQDKRYREAQKRVREAEKALRDARKAARIEAREARERLRRAGGA